LFFISSAAEIAAAASNPNFDLETTLTVMKAFIVDKLQDKVISAAVPVSVCLGDCEIGDVYLSDTLWFQDYFPQTLKMSEIVEAFFAFSSGGGGNEIITEK
jgi:hypothetical protein